MRYAAVIWICFWSWACGGVREAGPKTAGSGTDACMTAYQHREWKKALDCLEEIPPDQRNVSFYDLQGTVFQETGDHGAAADAFQAAIRLDSLQKNVFLHFKLGETLWKNHFYAEAGEAFQKYDDAVTNPSPEVRRKVDYYLRSYQFAEKSYRSPRSFDLVPLPEEINSPDQELGVSLTYDRRTMVFTRRDHQEDLYLSRMRDGEWSEAIPVRAINTPDNEGAAAISGDGKTLVFTACNRPQGMGSCDIFQSLLKDTGWTRPEPVPGVNSVHWDSQPTLSPDGRAMIFSSERPGGYGGRDLWITVRNMQGRWIEPVNLGPSVNTSGNEENPHLHTDEQTLYFTSDYRPGFGGRDLFMTHRRQGNQWEEPKNLGFPINSHDNEEGIFVVSSGEKGYFASARSGQFDLYSFELDPEIRPRRAFLYQLIVLDEKTRNPVAHAEVGILDRQENRIIRQANTDEEGFLAFLMQAGKIYGATIDHEEYGFHSFRFQSAKELTEDRTDTIFLTPPERNEPIVLENVLFETGKAILQETAHFELDQLAGFLADRPQLEIVLTGHTDNVGSAEDNLQLSKDRAGAVKEYLEQKGIESSRIEAEGKGAEEPVASNETPEGRQMNRRTEMTIK